MYFFFDLLQPNKCSGNRVTAEGISSCESAHHQSWRGVTSKVRLQPSFFTSFAIHTLMSYQMVFSFALDIVHVILCDVRSYKQHCFGNPGC
jgi:hypothetical protein